jgi:phosphatidylglycerophosphatase A
MTKKNLFMVKLSTLGPIGKLPASGTFGSLCALPFVYVCADFWWYPLFVVVSFYLAKYIIDHALPYFKEKDPSEIVLDEWIGCLVIFVFIPLNYKTVFISFLLFRFFDSTKYCGVGLMEKIPGALGIIADDYYAALLAALVVRLWLFIIGV